MAYVENRTVHDADSHLMEVPGMLESFLGEADLKAFQGAQRVAQAELDWAEKADAAQDDPDFRAGDADNILLRKNHLALGSYRKLDRPAALDLLGFTSQLVFTTAALSNFNLEHNGETQLALAVARAHNRMMVDFCSVDRRLLATAYVPLVDTGQAARIAKEAIEIGAKALVIPSRCPQGHSPSHIEFDTLWALAEEAGVPVLFHVGGEEKMHVDYTRNGLPPIKDFHGGDENFTGLSYMTIPLSVWQTMTTLIFDGVCDRFPCLKFGAIELGASWLPSWMKYMDAGFNAFRKGEERLQKLSAAPSEIAQRCLRVTPYPHEDTGWIMHNSSEDMLLFSSDFPHVEGGRNPLKRFNDSLQEVGETGQTKFYRDNFIDLMGAALEPSLHDHPTPCPRQQDDQLAGYQS